MKKTSYSTYLLPVTWAVLLAALTVGILPAQNYGRLVLVVKDDQGKPVSGVTVSATCDELPKFTLQKITDKKGKATLAFGDATKTYNIKVEYEGFPPIEMPFKPEIRKSKTQEVKLSAATNADAAAQGPVIYTPAERIFNEGVEAARGGDYETARARFLAALDKNPDLALAHSALGGLHTELGEYDSAIASAERLLELEPGNPRGYRILYDAYTALGKEDLAKKALANMASADDSGDAAILLYNEGVAAL
ncbi:MAG: tetratricopeptide repeat protein, partial [bacterium]|nr:tetratricopeptide repeat protein [bacterium]